MRRILALLLLFGICTTISTGVYAQNFYVPGFISKRAIINTNFVQNITDYAFINFIQEGRSTLSPASGSYNSGTNYWNSSILDATGYPTTSCSSSCQVDQFNISLPSSGNFGGNSGQYFCLQGRGSGTLSWTAAVSGALFTILAPSSGNACGKRATGTVNWSQDDCTAASGHGTIPAGGTTSASGWAITDNGNGWCIAFQSSGIPVATINFQGKFTTNDPSNTGAYINALAIYESQDVSDWASGNWFRAGYKQPIVTLDPGAIRFMNWNGAVSSTEMRFENRPTPYNEVGYAGVFGPVTTYPPYTVTSGTNQYTLSAASGTPSSMKHGEIARFRLGTSSTVATQHGGNYAQTITQITVPTAGIVQIETNSGSSPHGFNAGDTIELGYVVASNATVLNLYYASGISVGNAGSDAYCGTDTSCFRFSFTTTSMCAGPPCTLCNSTTTCGAGTCTTGNDNCAYAVEGLTLQAGSGNDRTAYPLIQQSGAVNFSYFFNLTAGQYYKFCFNKNAAGETDGSGNLIYGAWVDCNSTTGVATDAPVPLELQTQLINELNAMNPTYPINMWVNIPHMGLIPSDPDYTTASDYPVNMIKTILNGANGFTGLTSGCPKCTLLVEDANETWNTAGNSDGLWFAYLSQLPGSNPNTGCGTSSSPVATDINTYSTLHAELVIQDIKNNAGASNIKYILAGHGNYGVLNGPNFERITGDGIAYSGCWPAMPTGAGAPIVMFDYFAIATYTGPSSAFTSSYLTTGTCPSPSSGDQGSVGCANQWVYDAVTYGSNSTQAQNDLQSWVTNGIVADASQCATPSTCVSGNSVYAFTQFADPCLAILLGTGGFSTPSQSFCGAPSYSIPAFSRKFLINYEGGTGETISNPFPIYSLSCTGGVVTADTKGNTNYFSTNDYVYILDAVPSAYNGVWQVASTGTPDATAFTFSITSCPVGTVTSTGLVTEAVTTNSGNTVHGNGFIIAVDSSQAWGNAEAAFFQTYANNQYMGLPSVYTFIGSGATAGNGNTVPCSNWMMACTDAYGATTTEGNGYFPIWYSLGTYNASYPYLLNRDLDPTSNDNSPVGINKAA
jgi:hypothetical protein